MSLIIYLIKHYYFPIQIFPIFPNLVQIPYSHISISDFYVFLHFPIIFLIILVQYRYHKSLIFY